MAGPRLNNRYLIHVGGAGRLMELQGPAKYQDPFAKEILRFNRGGIVSALERYMQVTPALQHPNRWVDHHIYLYEKAMFPDQSSMGRDRI